MSYQYDKAAQDRNVRSEPQVTHVALTATTTSYDMDVNDHVLFVTESEAGAGTVYLPPVAQAVGIYTVYNVDDTNDINLVERTGETTLGWTNIDLDAGEYAVVYGDGVNWFTLLTTG